MTLTELIIRNLFRVSMDGVLCEGTRAEQLTTHCQEEASCGRL